MSARYRSRAPKGVMWASIALAAGFVFAGCGGTTTSGTSAPTPTTAAAGGAQDAFSKPCRLFTEAEAERILGFDAKSVEGKGVCSYTGARDGKAAGITILVQRYKDAKTARKFLEQLGGAISGGEDVPGLGDSATYFSSLSQVQVLKGRIVLLVTLIGLSTKEDTVAVARTALDRL